MTRRRTILFALLALLVMPAFASASTVTLTDWTTLGDFSTNSAGGGGAFLATTTSTGGDPVLGDLGSLITFCIEFNEHFNYDGTYNFSLSQGAINGGVSGQDPVGSNFDPVSDATKWIYAEVVSGGYSSVAAFGTGDVGARVQEAIWFIEGERQQADISADSLALANFALSNQNWNSFSSLGYTVYAMNVTDAAGGLHQDQLAYTFVHKEDFSVPEPASLLLLGTGVLAVSRRRFNKA